MGALTVNSLHDSNAPMKVHDQMAEYAHKQQQKRAVTLLLVGALMGFCGFLVSTVIGYHAYHFTDLETNYLGEPFPSGNNYKPQTVSEMVHNPSTPEGKAFFAFCLIGAVCHLASWYPWELRNVYGGDDSLVFGCCGPSWANIRTFLPPIGMLLVACIPVKPPVNRDFGDNLVITFHTLGAVMMIGGYSISELHCLLCGAKNAYVVFKPGEWCIRMFLILIALGCGVVFQACGVLANKSHSWDCADEWRVPTLADLATLGKNATLQGLEVHAANAIRLNEKLLYNTAHGLCYRVKSGEFWFEVFAGVFMILNMLAIWYFCPERHIDFDESLPPLHKAEMRALGYGDEYVDFGVGKDPHSEEDLEEESDSEA